MTPAHTLAVLLVAGCTTAATPPTPTITTGALSWKIEQTEYSYTAIGTAPVQITDEAHAYLLIYRVYWEKKLDPAASADTSVATAVIVPGVPGQQVVAIGDNKSRCTEYSRTDCLRRAVDPLARLELVGWSRFERTK